jgi:hypothetical protein
MSVKIRGRKPDRVLKQIGGALEVYAASHPTARIETYRRNDFSVRVRIIDKAFAGTRPLDRFGDVRAVLRPLPEDTKSQISLLLLLTPEEAKESYGSAEFDHPTMNPPERRSRTSANGLAGPRRSPKRVTSRPSNR